jgi:ABC-type transport system substrate-binding protein
LKLRDRALIGALTVALIALSVAALAPTLKTSGGEAEPTQPGTAGRAYVEGVLGHATNASPFGARTAADRALVALLFRGLVKLGPGSSIVADLASSWDVDDSGRTWTFHLRPDQHWQDGEPITADDVAFTIDVLSSPAYAGPGGESWRDVTSEVIDERTVALHLTTPLGGFLQAATQPIAPAHILGTVPPDAIADDPFGIQPVASGPFRLVFLDTQRALLAAMTPIDVAPGAPGGPNFSTPRPTDSLATSKPTPRANVPVPYLANVEIRYYDDAATLRADWQAGGLDAAWGLQPSTRRPSRPRLAPGSSPTRDHAPCRHPRPARPGQGVPGSRRPARAPRGGRSRRHRPRRPRRPRHAGRLAHPAELDDVRRGCESGRRVRPGWRAQGARRCRLARVRRKLDPEGRDRAAHRRAAVPGGARQPRRVRRRGEGRGCLEGIGLAARLVPLPSTELLGDRLAHGTFQAAVLPLAIGLDPDVYPLLAASQTRTGGSNISGLQDPELDKLLVAARTPVDVEERTAAYGDLQKRLATQQYVLPLAFRDDYVVFRDTVSGRCRGRSGAPGTAIGTC